MSLFPPRRLVCFYCSAPANLTFDGSFTQFKCRSCDSDNYLDQKGEITDPPVFSATNESPKRLETRFTKPASDLPISPLEAQSDVVFCSTCQRNQQLLRAALSSYLPDINHPKYKDYEAAYPEYRSVLEQRYPQACAECQPKVSRQIRKVEYATRTMLLKNSIERSRSARVGSNSGPPGRRVAEIIINSASIAWWISVLVQVAWHAMALGVNWDLKDETSIRENELPSKSSLYECAKSAAAATASSQCFDMMTSFSLNAIAAGVLTFWWSPALHLKLQNPRLELAGVGQHVMLQVFILGLRILSWWTLTSPSALGLSITLFRGIHAFGIATMIMNITVSRKSMYAARRKRSLLKSTPASDNSSAQSSSVSWDPLSLPQTPRTRTKKLPATPFPISNLAASLPTDDLLKSSHYEVSDNEQSDSEVSVPDSDGVLAGDRTNEEDKMDCSDDHLQPSDQSTQYLFERVPPTFALQRMPFGHPNEPATNTRPSPPKAGISSPVFAPARFQRNSPFVPQGNLPISSFASPRSPRGLFERSDWASRSNSATLGTLGGSSISAGSSLDNPFLSSRQQSGFSPARSSLGSAPLISNSRSPPKLTVPEAKLRLGNTGTGLERLFNSAFTFQDDKQQAQSVSQTQGDKSASMSPNRRKASRSYDARKSSSSYYNARSVNLVVLVIGFLAILLGISGWIWSFAGRSKVIWIMPPPVTGPGVVEGRGGGGPAGATVAGNLPVETVGMEG